MLLSILIVLLILALILSPVLIPALVSAFHLVARLRNSNGFVNGHPLAGGRRDFVSRDIKRGAVLSASTSTSAIRSANDPIEWPRT